MEMEFKIQYFGSQDRWLYTEVLRADELMEALVKARGVLRQLPDIQDAEIAELPIGYVILDDRGRAVARGYALEAIAAAAR